MKYTVIFLLSLFLVVSCSDKTKEKELELKERELALKEKEIVLQSQQNQNIQNEPIQSSPQEEPKEEPEQPSVYGNAKISSNNVIFRNYHSTTSTVLGKFSLGERIQILDEYQGSSNENEAITTRIVALYDYSGNFIKKLPKGKAVQVEDSNDGGDYYVLVHDAKYGKLRGTVYENDLQFISGDTWYKVQKANGKVGWVFSKFVTR